MPVAKVMHEALTAFEKVRSVDCLVDHKQDKPRYALIKVAGWPSVVHYEFRHNKNQGLYAELHIESKDYEYLGETYQRLANNIKHIGEREVVYSPGGMQVGQNQKRWPSLSIELGDNVSGSYSAEVMSELISKTRSIVEMSLQDKNFHYEPATKIVALTYPDEISADLVFFEGAVKSVLVNVYERNAEARKACVDAYGFSCFACGFSFNNKYGKLGEGYIHVHHLKPISEIGAEYKVDPISDLRPVCPNCHAMIHRSSPPLSIEELKAIIIRNNG